MRRAAVSLPCVPCVPCVAIAAALGCSASPSSGSATGSATESSGATEPDGTSASGSTPTGPSDDGPSDDGPSDDGPGDDGPGDGPTTTSGESGDPPDFEPPYDLPAPGEVVLIGTNDAMDIVPEGMATSAWDYSLFNSYGGGTFVADYSAAGAYVLAGTGGHNHPRNVGAALFDFEDATWKRVDAIGATSGDSDYTLADLDGAPYYEVSGTTVPSPPHPYQTLCPLPTRLGGGPRGSVVYVTRSAIAVESVSSAGVHQFDLATGVWSRPTEDLAITAPPESSAVFDPGRDRFWFMPYGLHNYREAHFLDASDWSFAAVGQFPDWPSGELENGRVFLHEAGASTLVVRQGAMESLWAFDPDEPDLGWRRLTTAGTVPNNTNVFARSSDGLYYWMSRAGGNTVVRMTPPADAFAGTWTIDAIELVGPTMPERTQTSGTLEHYTALFYVPAIDVMAWIAGGEAQVALFRPPR